MLRVCSRDNRTLKSGATCTSAAPETGTSIYNTLGERHPGALIKRTQHKMCSISFPSGATQPPVQHVRPANQIEVSACVCARFESRGLAVRWPPPQAHDDDCSSLPFSASVRIDHNLWSTSPSALTTTGDGSSGGDDENYKTDGGDCSRVKARTHTHTHTGLRLFAFPLSHKSLAVTDKERPREQSAR